MRWFGSAGRGVTLLAGILLGLLLMAGPAAAHVEVSAEPAQAGAWEALVTFNAEAESGTAGIRSLQVQLPEGIKPPDVAWVSGPPGWSLTATADGYEVSGPPLQVGAPARYSISVQQLPNTQSLMFKTVQTYTDGSTDRWLDPPGAGGAEPANPAPVIALSPAADAGAPPASPAPAAIAPASRGLPVWAWAGFAALAAAIVIVAAVAVRRSRTPAKAGGRG